MKAIINKFFFNMKFVLFFIALFLTLYIVLKMNIRINNGLCNIICIFIPYFLLLLFFMLNIFNNNNKTNNNIFLNITSSFVFFVNIFVCLRAIYDKNMLLNKVYSFSINFTFFNDYLAFNNI